MVQSHWPSRTCRNSLEAIPSIRFGASHTIRGIWTALPAAHRAAPRRRSRQARSGSPTVHVWAVRCASPRASAVSSAFAPAQVSYREAMDYLRSHDETCIILFELQLSVMDGAHFRSAQLRDRSLAWIPALAMSATLDASRKARELGARRFLPKPLDLDEVRGALRQIGCCLARPRTHAGS